MTIKSHDVILEEGKGHHTISNAPTPTLDIAFDDDVNLTTPHDDKIPPGIIIPPKPLAPRPRTTNPPLHPDSTMEMTIPLQPNHQLRLDVLLNSPFWELAHPHQTQPHYSPDFLTPRYHIITGKP
jgi:hypothetical protein